MVASTSQTTEEVKLFELKFKGSLEKLDEFEREWSHFKTNNSGTPNISISIPGGGSSTTKHQFGGLNTIVEDDFDCSMKGKKTKTTETQQRPKPLSSPQVSKLQS
jgi:hypothetical protein